MPNRIILYSNQALEYLPEKDLSWRSAAAIALGDAYGLNREVEKAYQIQIEAYELSKAAGNIYLNLIASMKLAVTMRNLGRLHQIIELCEKQMQLINDHGMSQMAGTGWLLAVWGEVLAEVNDLDGAIDHVRRGVELTEIGTDITMRGWTYLCMLRVLYSRREMDEIDTLLEKIENFSRDFHSPPWVTTIMEAWKARIWLVQGKLENASKWVEERKLDYEHTPLPIEEHEYLAFARILIAQGRVDESIRLLDRTLKSAEEKAYKSRVIEILILKALAFQSDGDLTKAMTTLNHALKLAEPGGFIRIFLDEGPPFALLLNKAIYRGVASDYARRLLPYFQDSESEEAAPEKMLLYKDELIEPLSEREIEVLKLVAEGLTNQEIAGRLFLSLNTIKVHNRHIFAKLNANSRLQAVSKARDVGILEQQ
jgi:LuxR family maltose regulon positive regulatory protein